MVVLCVWWGLLAAFCVVRGHHVQNTMRAHTPVLTNPLNPQGSVSKYIQKYSHQPVIVLDERIRQSIDVQRASIEKKVPETVPEFKSTFA